MFEAANESTHLSLLNHLQQRSPLAAEEPWRRFVKLYTPLLLMWARRVGADEQDVSDLVQEVFVVIVQELASFRREPGRRFRGWLWTILLNKWRDRVRQRAAQPAVAGLEHLETVAVPDNVEEIAEQEYRAHLIGRALELMRAELPDVEWRACQEYVIAGRAAAEVARELALSVNQVYLVKSRILRRLRTELEGLLD